ncbi:unnamed protein product [Leptosia nina]|uniref:Uncharacterized protein n=1 Tax=Leptosia nina TaxID=320188 RepID=A0AAV1JFD6_9NEOP
MKQADDDRRDFIDTTNLSTIKMEVIADDYQDQQPRNIHSSQTRPHSNAERQKRYREKRKANKNTAFSQSSDDQPQQEQPQQINKHQLDPIAEPQTKCRKLLSEQQHIEAATLPSNTLHTSSKDQLENVEDERARKRYLNKQRQRRFRARQRIEWHSKFSHQGHSQRSKESLIRVWEQLKVESKLYVSSLQDTKQDPFLDLVCSILGRGCSGACVADCDMDFNEGSSNEQTYQDHIQEPLVIVEEVSSKEEENQNENSSQWPKRKSAPRMYDKTVSTSCLSSSSEDIHKKKENTDEMKETLLQEEIDFKRQLYALKIQSAEKDLEIRNEILKQIKGGAIQCESLYGMLQQKELE